GGHALDFKGRSAQQGESSRADGYLASEQARKSRLQLRFVAVQRDQGRESRDAEYQYYQEQQKPQATAASRISHNGLETSRQPILRGRRMTRPYLMLLAVHARRKLRLYPLGRFPFSPFTPFFGFHVRLRLHIMSDLVSSGLQSYNFRRIEDE